jgi:hypothetical protein
MFEGISAVGPVAALSSPQASKVKVRNVACAPEGEGAAICHYEANRCLDHENDSDGDGWCQRQQKFVRIDRPLHPFHVVMIRDGWTIDRAATDP